GDLRHPPRRAGRQGPEGIRAEHGRRHCRRACGYLLSTRTASNEWNTTQFANEALGQFGLDIKSADIDPAKLNHAELVGALIEAVKERYEEKEKLFGPEMMRWLERRIVLDIVDTQWKDHLLTLDHLKEG